MCYNNCILSSPDDVCYQQPLLLHIDVVAIVHTFISQIIQCEILKFSMQEVITYRDMEISLVEVLENRYFNCQIMRKHSVPVLIIGLNILFVF